MIENYIRINGKYILQQDVPEDKMREISRELMIRIAAEFDYVPGKEKREGACK